MQEHLSLTCFSPYGFAANTYRITSPAGTIIIDPASEEIFSLPPSPQPLSIIVTHGHYDHILLANDYHNRFSAPLYAHPLENALLLDPALNLSLYFDTPFAYQHTIVPLEEGKLPIPGFTAEVCHLPGHSPGSVGIFFPEQKWLFSGDVIFDSSIGRTDLPGGDEATLWNSIERLLQLPDDTVVYPGHGESFFLSSFRNMISHWKHL